MKTIFIKPSNISMEQYKKRKKINTMKTAKRYHETIFHFSKYINNQNRNGHSEVRIE